MAPAGGGRCRRAGGRARWWGAPGNEFIEWVSWCVPIRARWCGRACTGRETALSVRVTRGGEREERRERRGERGEEREERRGEERRRERDRERERERGERDRRGRGRQRGRQREERETETEIEIEIERERERERGSWCGALAATAVANIARRCLSAACLLLTAASSVAAYTDTSPNLPRPWPLAHRRLGRRSLGRERAQRGAGEPHPRGKVGLEARLNTEMRTARVLLFSRRGARRGSRRRPEEEGAPWSCRGCPAERTEAWRTSGRAYGTIATLRRPADGPAATSTRPGAASLSSLARCLAILPRTPPRSHSCGWSSVQPNSHEDWQAAILAIRMPCLSWFSRSFLRVMYRSLCAVASRWLTTSRLWLAIVSADISRSSSSYLLKKDSKSAAASACIHREERWWLVSLVVGRRRRRSEMVVGGRRRRWSTAAALERQPVCAQKELFPRLPRRGGGARAAGAARELAARGGRGLHRLINPSHDTRHVQVGTLSFSHPSFPVCFHSRLREDRGWSAPRCLAAPRRSQYVVFFRRLDAAFDALFLRVLASATCVNWRCDAKPGGALTAIEGPHGAVPAEVMVVRGRGLPSPETLPNSKLLTKGRYELSSVRSEQHIPSVSRIVKSEKVGPTAQSGLAVCSVQSFRPSPEKCRRHVGPPSAP